MTAHILVIDDDPQERRSLKAVIESRGHAVHVAENDQAGLELLRKMRGEIDAVLLDLKSGEGNRLSVLSFLDRLRSDVPVIVQTAESGTDLAVEAMRAGAFDFVVKPTSLERIATAVSNALKLHESDVSGRPLKRGRSASVSFSDITAASAGMARVLELGRRAVQSHLPIMVEGEAGVGKEMLARAIHSASERSGRPFVAVNCAAIPHVTIEAVLFGRPDQDGVEEGLIGKFKEADGGTLFIEEIGDLPLHAQAKLLEAVQKGEIVAAGGRSPQKVDVRIIASTSKDLIEEVKASRFREDLYYRLSVFPITVPALRRRKEDIVHLARAFAERFSAEQRLQRPLGIGSGALALLTAYDWPGNVRQLENAVFRAVVLAEGGELTERDFPQVAAQLPGRGGPFATSLTRTPPPAASEPAGTISGSPFVAESGHAPSAALSAAAANVAARANVIVSTDESGNVRKLAEVEEELIRFALKFYRGQMSQVARKLGIGRSTLYRKLKDYGIDPDNPQKDAA